MSECQQFEELIGAYSDGELSRAEACRVAGHLSDCSRCRQELKEIEGVHGIHIMAIEWEQMVSRITEMAGLSPRPKVE